MILATLENMQRHAAPDVVAYSPETGMTYSAHPGDYFALEPGDFLKDDEGHAMILARRIPEQFQPIERPA